MAFSLSAERPREAQRLLQEALEKRRAKQSGGSLVLVLDKVSSPRVLHRLPPPGPASSPPAVPPSPSSSSSSSSQHLQKLPWESMACLRAVPVTRLPSLRFLLSYSLAREVRGSRGPPRTLGDPPNPSRRAGTHSSPFWQRGGSVLSRGIDPSSTFYVLNPHKNLPGTEEQFRSWFER